MSELERSLDYARDHQQQHLNELIEFLRIPSVSTLPEHRADVQRAAEWLAENMRRAGLSAVEVFPTAGHPVVYGEWMGAGPDAPTVLVYGHYDVQPVDPIDLWDSPPFEPEIRDGELYARGASDDKGQLFVHVKAAEAMLNATGGLPVNVKMLFEGEEEIGSPHLEPFVLEHKDLLAADSALVSDSRILDSDTPCILYGLRGLTYMEGIARGPARDLHSGTYGGSVHNPAQVIGEIIAALHDENGRVAIPGFYDDVRPLTDEEREQLARVPYSLEQWQEETGLDKPWGEPEYTLLERVSARPTCDVNGIYGGFQGQGGKTIIPAMAGAKISMRLVPDQDPNRIAELFEDYVRSVAGDHVELEVINHNNGWWAITDLDSAEIQAAAAAYEATWGKRPVFTREGGSIPIVATFQRELGTPVVLMGFGLDDNIHSPNEHFRIKHFYRGIETVIHYYHRLAARS
jgi:acetylornithine deacetylase/succinyl-diaminopimelate desuccinylase-like protein